MKIHFPELGPNIYVELKDFKRLSWGDSKKIALAAGTMEDTDDVEAQLRATDTALKLLIKNGHIVDADDQLISFPLDDDGVNRLPRIVAQRVMEEYAKFQKEAVPKK